MPLKSPLRLIDHPVASAAEVYWYVKRDDLFAPEPGHPLQGNKIRKLSGWLKQRSPEQPMLTFGGAFSNHLAATAAAGEAYGFSTIGMVRGEEVHNPILDYCRSAGMQLHFVSRSAYRQKHTPDFQRALSEKFGSVLIVPEGGSGLPCLAGGRLLMNEIIEQLGQTPDYVQVAAGTGGTAAGIITAKSSTVVEAFSVLKGDWMRNQIISQFPENFRAEAENLDWSVVNDYHFGGYAKSSNELSDFIEAMRVQSSIPLEPVYSAKLFYGVVDRIGLGHYPAGSTLVTYHSGGILRL